MKTIEFSGKTGICKILLGRSFSELGDFCAVDRAVLVVDENVFRHHEKKLAGYPVIIVEPGEKNKCLATVDRIYERFLDLNVDRSSMVIGVGGGITCDITGFAASTFMRGIPFAFAPTTLLALVDASVGGKNGVNYHGYKNLVGTFNQPGLVLTDFSFLGTLPHEELKNGFAEVVKHALIGNGPLFDHLEEEWRAVTSLDYGKIEEVVSHSLAVKIGIVSLDETEKGERRKLNFGHTVGHAIEKATGYSHGEAVSVGMVAAAKLSELKGTLGTDDVNRIERLLRGFHLPTRLPEDKEAIIEALSRDKKREGDDIHFVLLEGIGRATIERITIAELREVLRDLC